MKRFKRWGRRFFYSLLLILATIGGMQFLPTQPTHNITASLIGERLEAAQELTTTKYHYQNTAEYNESKEFHGWKLPFTTKEMVVSYDGLIHAGVEMDQIDVKVDQTTIYISLPKSQILSHEIDPDSLTVLHEKSPWLHQLQVDDLKKLASSQRDQAEQEAIDHGLLNEANQTTQQVIQELLTKDPTILEHYVIEFI